MKKLIISICLLFAFFIPVVTHAADGQLKSGDFEMECVYDNGSSITTFYDGTSYIMQYSEFKLANAITPPFKSAITVFYNENEWGKQIIQSGDCPNSITLLPVQQTNGSNSVVFQVVVQYEIRDKIPPEFFTKQHVGGFQATGYTHVGFSLDPASTLYKRSCLTVGEEKAGFEFYLVSERVHFAKDVEPRLSTAFKHEGQQASSTPTYIKLSEYFTEDHNWFGVLEKDGIMTTMQIDYENGEEYYNPPEEGFVRVACFY